MNTVSFFVHGEPKPGGSKRVFINRKTGKPIVTDDAGKGNKNWREAVKTTAIENWKGGQIDFPIRIDTTFYVSRPQSHYWPINKNHNGELREDAPVWSDKKPDLDKLRRSTIDALKDSGIIRDDALCVQGLSTKYYGFGGHIGCRITLREPEITL